MKLRLDISLLAWSLVLALGMGIVLWQLREPALSRHDAAGAHQHAASEGGPQPMYAWHSSQAQRIELRAAGGNITILRSTDSWKDAPQGFDAQAFVDMLSRARADRRFAPDAANDYGLEPGLMTIHILGGTGQSLARLTVGDRLPDGIGRYARKDAERDVLVVPEYQVRPALLALAASGVQAQPDQLTRLLP